MSISTSIPSDRKLRVILAKKMVHALHHCFQLCTVPFVPTLGERCDIYLSVLKILKPSGQDRDYLDVPNPRGRTQAPAEPLLSILK